MDTEGALHRILSILEPCDADPAPQLGVPPGDAAAVAARPGDAAEDRVIPLNDSDVITVHDDSSPGNCTMLEYVAAHDPIYLDF